LNVPIKIDGAGEAHISEAQRRNVEAEDAEGGRSLMMQKILLKLEKEVENPVQRNSLFRTVCKTKDRVCKVIVHIGSTNNLVSTEMVEKLELEIVAHPSPYKVLWLQKRHQVTVTKQCLVEFNERNSFMRLMNEVLKYFTWHEKPFMGCMNGLSLNSCTSEPIQGFVVAKRTSGNCH
jgi:hypothetical protein